MSMTLLAWRRAVAALYADVRTTSRDDPVGTATRFRIGRDRLFRDHPDSPLPARARTSFVGVRYWPYLPELRFDVVVEPLEASPASATSVTGDTFALRRIGEVHLPIGRLEVYWIEGYGGGVFVPFRDATSGRETYGGGRYLIDTIKGADLGGDDGRLILDFNYAYHPSCVYDRRWSCPLAPPANQLTVPIRAGERLSGVPDPTEIT